MTYRYYYHTNDKNRVLAYSHYSDPAFKKEAVIFGEKRDGLDWDYADRLRQWDPEKSKSAWETAVREHGDKRTAARIETYLRYYYDNPDLNLVCVISGTQPFNGYPWHAYGYNGGNNA